MKHRGMEEGERFKLFDGRWYTYHEPEEMESLKLCNSDKIIKKSDTVTVFLSGKPTVGKVIKVYRQQFENRIAHMVKVCVTATSYVGIPIEHIEYRNYGKRGYYEST